MDDLEDLLAQHASVTMNLGLKDHSVSRRDALLGQSLAEKDRAEARNFTRRGDGVAPGEPWQCHCCAQDNVADAFKCRCCGRPASYGRPDYKPRIPVRVTLGLALTLTLTPLCTRQAAAAISTEIVECREPRRFGLCNQPPERIAGSEARRTRRCDQSAEYHHPEARRW